MIRFLFILILLVSTTGALAQEQDSIAVQLGEKLFLEDRFSQSYYKQVNGDTNRLLETGEPTLQQLETPFGLLNHPQADRQVSCSSCHLVDQAMGLAVDLVFTYNDFSATTPIPLRRDEKNRTTRNSMNMVGSSLKDGRPLHWDGEFFSAKQLSCASLVGRNMGWLNSEAAKAKQHIVKVLRNDSGVYPSESELKESYHSTFLKNGMNLKKLSDEQVFQSACSAIADYLKDLDFSRSDDGAYNLSAYDQFLQANQIRRKPQSGESQVRYLQYVRQQLRTRNEWAWVTPTSLAYHQHDSRFGPKELEGMKLFFGKTQCASCHRPPEFTNFSFHNTGITQFEYDQIHGRGAFIKVAIPSFQERNTSPEKNLIATAKHPSWSEPFRQRADKKNVRHMDLGVWNMLGHPDKMDTQEQLRASICSAMSSSTCARGVDQILPLTIGAFKTPTLRSLGQSAPYLHNGMADNLEAVLVLYFQASMLAKAGALRNPDPFMSSMTLRPYDFSALKAFIESLDEDYD